MSKVEHINLASELNAKLINQRFKELNEENNRLRDNLKKMELSIATLNNKLDSQMQLYQQFFVKQYGTGSTETKERNSDDN